MKTTPKKNRRLATAKAILSQAAPAPKSFSIGTLFSRNTLRVLAGGAALYSLAKLAERISASYPKVGDYISENIEGVEEKIQTWTGRGTQSTEAHA